MNGISSNNLIRNWLLFFTLFMLAFPVVAKEKAAGKTLLTRGSVIAKRSSGRIALKRRSRVFEKDEIRVGKNGRAQFRMIDQALISLQENSVLKIRKYNSASGKATGSVLIDLLSGGLRTITGAIGRGTQSAYELRTPLATIGVRGTDYEVEIVSNGMYVATWEGTIQLKSRLKNGCNMLVGRSQPFMFVYIDRLGNCTGLQKVPLVFKTGHSSNISVPRTQNNRTGLKTTTGKLLEPLQQKLPIRPAQKTFKYQGINIDQSRPSTKIISNSSASDSSTPTFKVGRELYNLADNGQVSNFQQSVGGYKVSWGFWNEFSTTTAPNTVDLNSNGMIWAAYDPTDVSIVSARTGTFRYENVTDSLLSGSSEQVNNLQIQMDVNFESGNVTNGALSANTSSDTWVAVFDGKITSGDLALQLNGASVIDSTPETTSPVRNASGFITGDFVGNNAQAVVGGFGLSEDNTKSPNHIGGTFIVE